MNRKPKFFEIFVKLVIICCYFAASKINHINPQPRNKNITALHPRELAIMARSNLVI